MFWFGVFVLGVCLWLTAWKRKHPSSPQKQEKLVDWLLTGGLAVFLLLVFRIGWAQAFLRLQYWLYMLLPFLRQGDVEFERRQTPAEPSAQMNRTEAARILGVEESASEIEIQKAYKQLMVKLHPDRGGNSYLAGKLNEARDCLLKK